MQCCSSAINDYLMAIFDLTRLMNLWRKWNGVYWLNRTQTFVLLSLIFDDVIWFISQTVCSNRQSVNRSEHKIFFYVKCIMLSWYQLKSADCEKWVQSYILIVVNTKMWTIQLFVTFLNKKNIEYSKNNKYDYTTELSTTKGVPQGDLISPKLFTAAMENIFCTLDWNNQGLSTGLKAYNIKQWYTNEVPYFQK